MTSHIHRYTHVHTGIHRYAGVYTGILRYTQVHTGIHRCTQYTQEQFENSVFTMQLQACVYLCAPEYTCVYPCVLVYTPAYLCIPVCAMTVLGSCAIQGKIQKLSFGCPLHSYNFVNQLATVLLIHLQSCFALCSHLVVCDNYAVYCHQCNQRLDCRERHTRSNDQNPLDQTRLSRPNHCKHISEA